MKKLAIIGASYLQLPLVKKAKEMGIETHCFAWPDGAVCKDVANYFYPVSVLDKEAILQHCLAIGIDGITTIATDIAVPTISYIAEKMNLTGNSYTSAINATNKWHMRDAFLKNGCPVPAYKVVTHTDETTDGLTFPVIIKPVDRSGSRGVSKIDSDGQTAQAIAGAIEESTSNTAIIEEYIEGDEVSVESISWLGRHYILAITDKVTTGAPHFVELAHHQPSTLSHDIQIRIKEATINALNALDVKHGAGHTEMKITTEGKIYIIEVGARMGGDFIGSHMVELSTGYDFVKGVIEVALGYFTEPVIAANNNAGIYFLSKDTQQLLPLFATHQEYEVEKEVTASDLKYITNSNDRSGYLIYQSSQKINLL